MLRILSNFVEKYLLPITQNRLWPAIYPFLIILVGLMSAFQQPYIGDLIRVLFLLLLILYLCSWAWLRVDPRRLKFRWVSICQRHHTQFFQGLMLATAILNFAIRRAPHLEVVTYRRGSVLDYVQEERAELTRRFPETVGYLVTFDGEAEDLLVRDGVSIGGKSYKLASMRVLGLGEDFRLSGLRLDERAGIEMTAKRKGRHARALFWGLSGVVVKQPVPSASVGGYPLKTENGQYAVDLQDIIEAMVSDNPPQCPIYILNWPVLLWNLVALTLTGKADLHLENEISAAKSLMDKLKAAVQKETITVVDNPYVLMEAVEADKEAIIIGGGTWLLTEQMSEASLLPIWSRSSQLLIFSKYIECLGYLLPDGNPSPEIRKDVERLDSWIARRFAGEIFKTTPADRAARVGLPCWVSHVDTVARLPGVQSLKGIEVLDRVIPTAPAMRLAVFEIV